MPTNFTDQFYTFDPANPPPVGTAITFQQYTLTDQNDDGDIDQFDDDAVAGLDVTATWPGDTVTISVPGTGDVTYTGTTVYISDGSVIFTPSDGQVLAEGTFVSATHVTVQGPLLTNQLGPTCFLPGSLISTPAGPKDIEELRVGELVNTLDRGPIPIKIIRTEVISGRQLFDNPRRAPVRIPTRAFSYNASAGDLIVSPQHRMLIRSEIVRRMFGVDEVLAPAAQLIGFQGIERVETASAVRYMHLLLDHHSIIEANGLESESLYLSSNSLTSFSRPDLIKLRQTLNPSEIYAMAPARIFAEGRKLKQLLNRHKKNGKLLCEKAGLIGTTSAEKLLRFVAIGNANQPTADRLTSF